MDDKAKVEVKDADRIERVAQLFEALHNKAAAIVVRTVGFCGIVHYAAADFLDLVSSKAAKAERDRLDNIPTNWELTWGPVDDDDGSPCVWLVYRRSGGRSDKEWTLLATGETPTQAIADALESQSDCPHDRTSTASTGDGVEVIFCTNCGKNIHIGQMPWQDGDALESQP